MRAHRFGEIFIIRPSYPLIGSAGAFNEGVAAVCISSEAETEFASHIMAAKLSGKIELRDYNSLTIMIRTPEGKRYLKLLSAAPVPKYRVGKRLGEISEDEKSRLKDALRLLFEI